MSRLGGIELLVLSVDHGSFAGAARASGMTSSAVSKAVSRLEVRLGTQLLRRTTRSLAMTADGHAFVSRAREGLERIAEAEALLSERTEAPRGKLRVSAPVVFGHRILGPWLPSFAARYPDVALDIHCSDRLVDLVEDGFDISIRTGRLDTHGLVARRLLQTRFVTAASPAYLDARGCPQHPDELEHHHCTAFVFPSTQRVFAWPFDIEDERMQVIPSGVCFNHADTMIAACEAGLGLVHLQDYLLAPSLSAGRLVPVLGNYAADGGPVSLVYLPSRHLAPRVRAFIDALAEHLQT